MKVNNINLYIEKHARVFTSIYLIYIYINENCPTSGYINPSRDIME